ncbi:hypothetical protein BGZ89_002931, partial [Linnemannia elongata]
MPILTRSIATSTGKLTHPVSLSFTDTPKPSPQEHPRSQPIVVMHGLFGSKQNWKALSKAMAHRLNTRVITLDLRNHGESGHSEEHDYANMVNDVVHFLKEQSVDKPIVIGHSMGGKVAMNLALKHAAHLDRLVVVDMAPVKVKLSTEFAKYVGSMKEIQDANVKKQSEADTIMKKTVSDLGFPETLGNSLEKLGHFDFVPGQDKFDGKVLFIRGVKSKYIMEKEMEAIRSFFPQARIESLDTGHW